MSRQSSMVSRINDEGNKLDKLKQSAQLENQKESDSKLTRPDGVKSKINKLDISGSVFAVSKTESKLAQSQKGEKAQLADQKESFSKMERPDGAKSKISKLDISGSVFAVSESKLAQSQNGQNSQIANQKESYSKIERPEGAKSKISKLDISDSVFAVSKTDENKLAKSEKDSHRAQSRMDQSIITQSRLTQSRVSNTKTDQKRESVSSEAASRQQTKIVFANNNFDVNQQKHPDEQVKQSVSSRLENRCDKEVAELEQAFDEITNRNSGSSRMQNPKVEERNLQKIHGNFGVMGIRKNSLNHNQKLLLSPSQVALPSTTE